MASNVEERRRGIEKEYKTNWPRSRLARSSPLSLFFSPPPLPPALLIPATNNRRVSLRRFSVEGGRKGVRPRFSALPIFNLVTYVRTLCRSNRVTGTNSR